MKWGRDKLFVVMIIYMWFISSPFFNYVRIRFAVSLMTVVVIILGIVSIVYLLYMRIILNLGTRYSVEDMQQLRDRSKEA